MWSADFSNMFATRNKENIPPSVELLLDSIKGKPIGELCFNDNALGIEAAKSFVDFLKNSSNSLYKLGLENCGMSPEAIRILIDGIKENENKIELREILLSRNRIQDDGAVALAEYLAGYDSLELLEISSNIIKDEGMTALLNSLIPHAESGKLVHLVISDNFITSDESTAALCELVRRATNLQKLSIDGLELVDGRHE